MCAQDICRYARDMSGIHTELITHISIHLYLHIRVWLWGDVGKWGFAVGKGGLCVAAGHTVTII